MRYRTLSPSGDYTFGQSQANFLINTPAAIAQAVTTRLQLFLGTWFLDQTDGTPWFSQVLGTNTEGTYDAAIQARILDTPGVVSLVSYNSQKIGRTLSVQATIDTIYSSDYVSTAEVSVAV